MHGHRRGLDKSNGAVRGADMNEGGSRDAQQSRNNPRFMTRPPRISKPRSPQDDNNLFTSIIIISENTTRKKSLAIMSDAAAHGTGKGSFAPKTAVELAPPKDDPITVEYLSKCDGNAQHSFPRVRDIETFLLMACARFA
jgi:hypothetical protein